MKAKISSQSKMYIEWTHSVQKTRHRWDRLTLQSVWLSAFPACECVCSKVQLTSTFNLISLIFLLSSFILTKHWWTCYEWLPTVGVFQPNINSDLGLRWDWQTVFSEVGRCFKWTGVFSPFSVYRLSHPDSCWVWKQRGVFVCAGPTAPESLL